MKQLLQNLKTGSIALTDVPCPRAKPGHLLIRTRASLISAGTERMLLEFGKASWLGKARRQPERVRQVWEKMRTDGVAATLESVRVKLDQPLPLGYCNAGVALETGERVVSNGYHAEVVRAPKNLCAKIPDGVADEEACFTVAAAVALQGIRLAQPTLGECFVVTGLGLIGMLAVQLLRAQGCRVMGIDPDRRKLSLARSFGAETSADAMAFSRGRGVDGVLIAASTASSDPVHQAALMCRKRGRIVLVGVTGLELSREDFYKKELTFQVSCSYGPGRYDPAYEEGGQDYPEGYVRWTAQRNFEAVLDMMAERRLDVRPLITHRFGIERAGEAYELLQSGEPHLGILLEYPTEPNAELLAETVVLPGARAEAAGPVVGFIGAGAYASKVLIPAFRESGAELRAVASSGGISGAHAARKFGFALATTDVGTIFSDPRINAVVIATRHDTHAELVIRALGAGKHVFVEKPLALNREELREIERACDGGGILMVGFNRRFAPQARKIRELLAEVGAPKSFLMTVNAGTVPSGHWTEDPNVGGGRMVGEACHFVDLLRYLAGAPVKAVHAFRNGTFTLEFADGSVGTVHYLTSGHRSFPKERLEVFCAGRVLRLDNFRKLTGYGWPGFRGLNLWKQDKGNAAAVAAFVDAVREGRPSPIPFAELIEVSRVTFELR